MKKQITLHKTPNCIYPYHVEPSIYDYLSYFVNGDGPR